MRAIGLLAKQFHALAHPTRLGILSLLQKGPESFPKIVYRLLLTPPLASHHLRILLEAGWITKSKFGTLVTYQLRQHAAAEIKRSGLF